ncbi:MAG: hypothetical protein CM1200mP29_13960 [Verrucomicrobiota bacterium]|nr:MAG: hypothetical protein CM1200mP29_13960 [Verrucomicrobiota bacterium]
MPHQDALPTMSRSIFRKKRPDSGQNRGNRKSIYSNLTPWQRVQLRATPETIYLDYIRLGFDDFSEVHGTACTPMTRRWSAASPVGR